MYLSLCQIYCFIAFIVLVANNSPVVTSTAEHIENKEEHLVHAAAQGNLSELKKALKAGAQVNKRDGVKGNSALIWAALNGHVEIMQALLSAGADVEIRSFDGHKTPLLMTSFKGHTKATEFLLSKGAVIDAKNDRGDSSLSIAAYMGHTDIVNMLLERGSTTFNDQTNKYGYSPLHFSCHKGHVDITRLLVLALVELDAVDQTGKTPLMLAAMEGHADIVRLLTAHDADLAIRDKNGNTALMLTLLSRKEQNTHLAGTMESLQALLVAGASVEAQNSAGYTALMFASSHNYGEAVSLLLHHEADCWARSNEGDTASSLAIKLGHESVSVLLRSGCEGGVEADDVSSNHSSVNEEL